MAAGEEGEEVEPEPEEEVDLLVDDVQREHAQRVELLLASRSAHAVERATESKRGLLSSSKEFGQRLPSNIGLLLRKL